MRGYTGNWLEKVMQIGVDARSLLPMRTGIGTYLVEILQHLSPTDTRGCFRLFSHRPVDIPAVPLVKTHIHPARWGLAWYLFQSWRSINSVELDLFWGVQGLMPFGLRRQLPVVVTIPDCVHRMGVGYAPSALYNYLHRLLLPVSVRRAQKILTISRFVAGEIHQYYDVPLNQIEVISPGVSDHFFRSNIREEKTQAVLEKYRILRPFIMAVGTLEPRKNLRTLLQAFAILPLDLRGVYHLVLAGKMGWHSESLEIDLRSHPLCSRIIRTGYISAHDLPHLYAGADMLVFPSLYEGFGFPALEAMAAGCPVIASSTSGLGELVGSAGILVDPYGPVLEWARAIEKVARSSSLRDELIKKGISRTREYRWSVCARTTVDLLYHIAGGGNS